MGIFRRAAKIVEANLADRREKARAPEDDLQAAYQGMLEQAGEVKRLIGEIALAHERAAQEAEDLERRMEDLEREAREALQAGDEARARERLERRRDLGAKLQAARERERQLRQKLDRLRDAQQELRDGVHAFEDRRDEAIARLSGAQAQEALQRARSAVEQAGPQALERLRVEAGEAEARAELGESLDDQLERLMREKGVP